MKMKRGTPAFGILMGILFLSVGLLWMKLGFWRTLLLAALFAAGYFIGAVDNKTQALKDTLNRVIPEKKVTPIDVKETITREQESALRAQAQASAAGGAEKEDGGDTGTEAE